MITETFGNSRNITQRTLYAQMPVGARDTTFRRIYNDLRSRWPHADVAHVIDAASEVALEDRMQTRIREMDERTMENNRVLAGQDMQYQYRYHNTKTWWYCDREQALRWLSAGYFDPSAILERYVDAGQTICTSQVSIRAVYTAEYERCQDIDAAQYTPRQEELP